MIVLAFALGLFVGAPLGFMAAALCRIAKDADRAQGGS